MQVSWPLSSPRPPNPTILTKEPRKIKVPSAPQWPGVRESSFRFEIISGLAESPNSQTWFLPGGTITEERAS